jgi:CubicO group peptidase (beta-lactamase class C family)
MELDTIVSRRTRQLGTWSLLVILWVIGQPAFTEDKFATVAKVCEEVRAELNAPGLSAAVAIQDTLVWSAGFGMADVENNVPARGNTVYRIASISKTFGATAVLQLVDAGRVSLDDPISKYVPSYRQPVTLRQIMTHTSGIRHYKPGESNSAVRYDSLANAIAIFRDDPLLFEPGTKVLYSSYAYNLLAGVIERASGKPLEAYLQDRIFAPANLESTQLDYPERIVLHRARPYVRTDQHLANAPYVDNSVKWIGGGLISSAEDLIRFNIALNTGKLVSPASQKVMATPGTLNDGTPIQYSVGWELSTDHRGNHYVDKYGSGTGVSTYLVRIPAKRFAVAVLINLSRGNIEPFARRIADAVLATEDVTGQLVGVRRDHRVLTGKSSTSGGAR